MSSSNNLFQNVFSDKMISHSNLYSTQTNIEKGSIGVDKNEIERYIGVLLRMSIFSADYCRLYWELDNPYKPVCLIFSRKCFEITKRFINFNDHTKDKRMTLTETGYIELVLCFKHSDKSVSFKVRKSKLALMNK